MIDFPNHPSPGQIFYAWKWDGEKWVMITTTGWAPLHSPDFTGMPTAPTPPPGSNDAKIATTAFVMEAIEHHIAGVSSFNNRTGHVFLELTDIVEAGGAPNHSPHFTGWPEAETAAPGTDSRIIATTEFVHDSIRRATDNIVNSWNRRTGDVELRWDDVEDVGGAPIREPTFLGFARGQTAPRRDETTRLANTIFVGRAIDDAREEIDEEIREVVRTSVRSWNQRTGHVTLRPSDLTAVGAAFLASPVFTGKPTAPTAPPDTNNQQLATTRYVDQAIRSNPGPPGAPGRPGEKGPPGPAGRGLVVVGHVARRQDLPRRDNEVGDIWTVGEDYEGFWWNGFVWLSLGFIRGARGPRGPAGPPTFIDDERPEDAERGDLWWNPEDRLFQIRVDHRWDQISPPIPHGGTTFIDDNDRETHRIDELDDWRQFSIGSNADARVILPSAYSGKILNLNFYFYGASSSTITLYSEDRMFVAGYLPGNPGAAVFEIIFSAHLSVSRSFFLIKQGNLWWIYNLTQAIPVITNSSIGIANRSLLGTVPGPPVSAPINAALQADMTWKIPIGDIIPIYSTYNIPDTIGIVHTGINFVSGGSTWIMPPSSNSRKNIFLYFRLASGDSFSLRASAGEYLFRVDGANTDPGGTITLTNNESVPIQTTIMAICIAGLGWVLCNQSRPRRFFQGPNSFFLSGSLPAPPVGTPDNAVLQANATWQEPSLVGYVGGDPTISTTTRVRFQPDGIYDGMVRTLGAWILEDDSGGAVPPGTIGQIWYRKFNNSIYIHDGTGWIRTNT